MITQGTIIIVIAMAILVFALPRKYFVLPFILTACFVPADQRVIILGLDFTALRILVLVGFMRTILSGEPLAIKWNSFDKIVFAWAICGAVVYVLQWLNLRAVIYKCGLLFDVIGLYWLFRISIRSWGDIKLAAETLAVCSLILAVLVGLEWATGKNPFEILGRVVTDVREGRYRCQASFPHSIMLGLFWATLVPLFAGFAWQNKHKLLFWSAAATCVFIVIATASSTPIMALLIILIALMGYRWRQFAGPAGWGLLASLAALHVVMEVPVWHLICRVTVVSGSTGWHRFRLVDQAIKHFDEWALIGCRDTTHWGMGLGDITNQYVFEGVEGGFATLVLFLVMIYMALRILLRLSMRQKEDKQQLLSWCLFVVFIGHCVAFLGVSYFGQITMLLYMMLSIVGFLNEGKESERHAATYQPGFKHS